jgi:hypothetical protein
MAYGFTPAVAIVTRLLQLKATQRQLHLGYITDTVQMKYYYPEEKVLFDQ